MLSKRRRRKKAKKKFNNLNPEKVDILPEPHSVIFKAKVLRVVDGDTIEIAFLHGGKVPMRMMIRVCGVDTPEKRTRNELEKQAALKVKEIVERWVGLNPVKAVFYKWDKFGGRIVGDILVHGRHLSEFLLTNKYAHPYTGKVKKIPFQDHELEEIVNSGCFV